MKKVLFFFLVLMVGAGLVTAAASPIHPPGAPSLDTALSEYGVDYHTVTPDTVLAAAPLFIEMPAKIQADPTIDNAPSGQCSQVYMFKTIDNDYWIRV